MQYIDTQGEAAVKTFGYIGNNLSLSYNYIWGPLADRIVKLMPEYVAPNTITLAGFLCVVLGHLLVMTSGQFGQPISSPVLIAFACLMLIYQSLDNVDGKQARRTSTTVSNIESSSPLGMLFDHGSDSLCSFLIGMSVLKILCVTNKTLMLFIIITHVLSVFFCAIWSQYNTNNFELGRVNPVDDGIPTVALVALLNCIIPEDFWTQKLLFTSLNTELLVALVVPLLLILVAFIRNTITLTHNSQNETLVQVLQPLLVLTTLASVWLFAPEGYLQHNFYPLMYTIGFLWSRNIIIMQLNYITKSRLNIWNWPFLVYVIGHLGLCLYSIAGHSYSAADLHKFALLMALLQVGFWLQFVFSVILQMKRILGIEVFSIQKQLGGVKPQSPSN